MKRKPLLILIFILVPFVSLLIYLTSLAMVPYGAECNGTIPPQYHEKCEVNFFGVYLFNPILKCKVTEKYSNDMSLPEVLRNLPLTGAGGKCDYWLSN